MDLEMTGLDPHEHVIVEIATLITDDELNVIAEGPDLVIHQSEAELAKMDDIVVKMHEHSGLTEEIRSSKLSLADAGAQTLEFLNAHIESAGTVPLCGNSIGTDRRFLAHGLPEIENFLHYRSVDVSSIKELARRWYPDTLAKIPSKKGAHRALGDIRESIDELRQYRRLFFRDPADGTGN